MESWRLCHTREIPWLDFLPHIKKENRIRLNPTEDTDNSHIWACEIYLKICFAITLNAPSSLSSSWCWLVLYCVQKSLFPSSHGRLPLILQFSLIIASPTTVKSQIDFPLSSFRAPSFFSFFLLFVICILFICLLLSVSYIWSKFQEGRDHICLSIVWQHFIIITYWMMKQRKKEYNKHGCYILGCLSNITF